MSLRQFDMTKGGGGQKRRKKPVRIYTRYFFLKISPYLIIQTSPTTISVTLTKMASPARMTVILCSDSILFCNPRNCLSLDQSLKAVTKMTTITARRMAKPSIHWASVSPASWCDEAGNSKGGMLKEKSPYLTFLSNF